MSKVKVMIAGKDYVFQSDEEPKYVTDLARQIDRGIKEVMRMNDMLSLPSACVLLLMDVLDQKVKLSEDKENLLFQIKAYIEENSKLNHKVTELSKRIEVLEGENKELWNEVEIYSLREKIDDK